MLIKLDMKNTFDRVKLSFLYQVLLSFGFSIEFVKLIKACIDRPWITPLVNGRPSKYFQASRGLCQGCVLSHFLYIMMVETLSKKLAFEKESGYIPGIKIERGVDRKTVLSLLIILSFEEGPHFRLLGPLLKFFKISG